MQDGSQHNDKDFSVNRTEQKELRRKLRNESTSAEALLWLRLKCKQLDGIRFRRQFGIGPYVIDFYSPELRFGIELDGQQHYTYNGKEHDQYREEFLQQHGVKIMRIENKYIFSNPEGVLRAISETVKKMKEI